MKDKEVRFFFFAKLYTEQVVVYNAGVQVLSCLSQGFGCRLKEWNPRQTT